jgi:hypothetical protein
MVDGRADGGVSRVCFKEKAEAKFLCEQSD